MTGFFGLIAHQYYTTLVNAFKQLCKSIREVLLLFRSLATQLLFFFLVPLTSPFICVHALLAAIFFRFVFYHIRFCLLDFKSLFYCRTV